MFILDKKKLKHSPRSIRFWECCLGVFYENLSAFKQDKTASDEKNAAVNINGLKENEKESNFYLDLAFEYYKLVSCHKCFDG